jgi:hypothetical protein
MSPTAEALLPAVDELLYLPAGGAPDALLTPAALPSPARGCDVDLLFDAYLDVPAPESASVVYGGAAVKAEPIFQMRAETQFSSLHGPERSVFAAMLDDDIGGGRGVENEAGGGALGSAEVELAGVPEMIGEPKSTGCSGSGSGSGSGSDGDAEFELDLYLEGELGHVCPQRAGEVSDAKVEDRRRRNREASSRSYYRRKMRTQRVQSELRALRARANDLFKREHALRLENLRLRRQLPWPALAVGMALVCREDPQFRL